MRVLQRKEEDNYGRFMNLTYEDFKQLAVKRGIDKYEKIGFPSSYREGYERYIFDDIRSKLTALRKKNKMIIDIGCGCSDLPLLLIENCIRNQSRLLLIDSKEMLDLLPDASTVEKYSGRFPDCMNDDFKEFKGEVDAIIVYSVIQHVFIEASIFDFLDNACSLLKEGGEILVGDIPNISKRKRFFSSEEGIKFHKKFSGKDELPDIGFNNIEFGKLDDGAVLGIMLRYRSFGYDTYLLPQNNKLPMANRREDVLIRKP